MFSHLPLDFIFHNNPATYAKQIWKLSYCCSLRDAGHDMVKMVLSSITYWDLLFKGT